MTCRASSTRSRTQTGPIISEQAAFEGLVHAVELGTLLYPKCKGLAASNRLAEIARRDKTVALLSASRSAFSDDSAADSNTSLYIALTDAIQNAMVVAIRTLVNTSHQAVVQHHQTWHDSGLHHDGGGMIGGYHG